MGMSKRDLVVKFAFYQLDKLDKRDDSLSADVREYVADKLLYEYESGILSSDDNIHGETDAQLKAFARRLVENRISDGYKVLKARLEKFESGEVADRSGKVFIGEQIADEYDQELSASSCDLAALGLAEDDLSDIIERLFQLLPEKHRDILEKLANGDLRPGDPEAKACIIFLRRRIKAIIGPRIKTKQRIDQAYFINVFRNRIRIDDSDKAFSIMLFSILKMLYRKPVHYRPKPRPVRPGSRAFIEMDEDRKDNDIPSYSPYQYPSHVCI